MLPVTLIYTALIDPPAVNICSVSVWVFDYVICNHVAVML